ncbi:unnamed protein product [Urochloa humidicola]
MAPRPPAPDEPGDLPIRPPALPSIPQLMSIWRDMLACMECHEVNPKPLLNSLQAMKCVVPLTLGGTSSSVNQ